MREQENKKKKHTDESSGDGYERVNVNIRTYKNENGTWKM